VTHDTIVGLAALGVVGQLLAAALAIAAVCGALAIAILELRHVLG
jgi:hypothetical protein